MELRTDQKLNDINYLTFLYYHTVKTPIWSSPELLKEREIPEHELGTLIRSDLATYYSLCTGSVSSVIGCRYVHSSIRSRRGGPLVSMNSFGSTRF